jgi:hypothetical protein
MNEERRKELCSKNMGLESILTDKLSGYIIIEGCQRYYLLFKIWPKETERTSMLLRYTASDRMNLLGDILWYLISTKVLIQYKISDKEYFHIHV